MGHAPVENATPFPFAAVYLLDESGRALCVPLLKATYRLAGSPAAAERRLVAADDQAPLDFVGRRFSDAEDASYLREPECASFVKPSSDVVLTGHALAARPGVTESLVELRVGKLAKRVKVHGDRRWLKGARIGAAAPFERIPLVYERALGGWDRSDPDPQRHSYEPRNPAGVGFRAPGARFEEGPLPNLEDPDDPLHSYGQSPSPAPACPGFVSPGWAPRAGLAGTLDAAWEKTRMPLLPGDFDRRFFNAASPGLVADGYLRGDEEVALGGVSEGGSLRFALPALRAPRCRVGLRRRADAEVALRLDTVLIDADAWRVYLLFRGHVALSDSAHDVRWIAVR